MKRSQAELEAIVAKQDAEKQFRADVSAIRSGYTQEEIDTWPEQVKEAEAWTADNSASTPMIDAMISANGRAKADHVANIMAKADAYRAAVGAALGKKQSTPQ